MGLIKAAIGSFSGTLADQWKEYFTCDSLDGNTLATRGVKHTGKRSSNTKGSDNVISNGSGIVVADGQCMVVTEGGKVKEIAAEPGEYTFSSSSEPSVFAGSFGKSLVESFKTMGRRIGYGGDEARDQRVYYFNTKEILDNKFGTPNPVPFRVVDSKIGLDLDVSIRCAGLYSYRISDPMKFYRMIAGNTAVSYTRSMLDSQLKAEFVSALQPAFARLSAMEMRPNEIVAHTPDLEDALNKVLSQKWGEARGLEVASVAISSLTLPEEDQEMIKSAQKAVFYSDPGKAAGMHVSAQAEAMKSAAANPAGAAVGFMGMGMASSFGGAGTAELYRMDAEKKAKAASSALAGGWKCPKCGTVNSGRFCSECGEKKVEEALWTCSCGTVNKGKFCSECGKKKPSDTCPGCGAKREGSAKFCPECGTRLE